MKGREVQKGISLEARKSLCQNIKDYCTFEAYFFIKSLRVEVLHVLTVLKLILSNTFQRRDMNVEVAMKIWIFPVKTYLI